MRERKVRNYDKAFKENAVKLYHTRQGSYEVVGKELGIPGSTLAGWVWASKKAGETAFPGKGHIPVETEEVVRLRKALAVVQQERDILKNPLKLRSLPCKIETLFCPQL